jgi:60 kDa SS-A/Ro ribonucleoprotein
MLNNDVAIQKSRIHPFKILLAQKVYATGHGVKGALTWDPVSSVIDALNEAFYTAFPNVTPIDKPVIMGIDISGSMTAAFIGGKLMTAREAAAAMALVTANVEKNYVMLGYFSNGDYSNSFVAPLQISPRMRLNDAVQAMADLDFGYTDCALPMLWAMQKGIKDAHFISYTDSETYAGKVHVPVALAQYRKAFSPEARSVCVGMTATQFTINDPNDKLCLDVAGFDGGAPSVIASFVRGASETTESDE